MEINDELSRQNNVSFHTRPFDILFCVSIASRIVKGAHFLQKLFQREALASRRILLIGEDAKSFFKELQIANKNVTCLDLLSHDELMVRMKQSKIVILPSLYDSSPNTLFEAIQCGCIPFGSKNIGTMDKLFGNLTPKMVQESSLHNEETLKAWEKDINIVLDLPEDEKCEYLKNIWNICIQSLKEEEENFINVII